MALERKGRFASLSEFETIKTIGQGSFGCALLVRHISDNQFYVSKQINVSEMSEKERAEAVRHRRCLRNRHKYPSGGPVYGRVRGVGERDPCAATVTAPQHCLVSWQLCGARHAQHHHGLR